MATTAQRLAALESWKTAHISGHVLSGHTHPHTHSESALVAHGHPDLAKWPHTHDTTPVPVPPPIEPPPPPPTGASVRVTSIDALKTARANPNIGEVVLANGTYPLTWLDLGLVRSQVAPVLVRAETNGGAILDLGGSGSPHLWFRNGCAYETWRGFDLANSHPGNNGVVMFGEGDGRAVHHLTLQKLRLLSSISAGPGPGPNLYTNGQGLYFSWSVEGNHDIVVEDLESWAALWSQVHIYHDDKGETGHDITVRRATFHLDRQAHAQMGIAAYSAKMRNYLFEDVRVEGANEYGFYHAKGGTMTLRRVVTVNSGAKDTAGRPIGFSSSLGSYPTVPGVTFDSCSFG